MCSSFPAPKGDEETDSTKALDLEDSTNSSDSSLTEATTSRANDALATSCNRPTPLQFAMCLFPAVVVSGAFGALFYFDFSVAIMVALICCFCFLGPLSFGKNRLCLSQY